MSTDDQDTKRYRNIAENFIRLSRVQCTNVTDRQWQVDDRRQHVAMVNVSSRSLKWEL